MNSSKFEKIALILFHGLKDEVVLIKFSKSVYKLFKTKNKQIIKIKKENHSLSKKNDLKKICLGLDKMITDIV